MVLEAGWAKYKRPSPPSPHSSILLLQHSQVDVGRQLGHALQQRRLCRRQRKQHPAARVGPQQQLVLLRVCAERQYAAGTDRPNFEQRACSACKRKMVPMLGVGGPCLHVRLRLSRSFAGMRPGLWRWR